MTANKQMFICLRKITDLNGKPADGLLNYDNFFEDNTVYLRDGVDRLVQTKCYHSRDSGY
jgi:hypothetical protein